MNRPKVETITIPLVSSATIETICTKIRNLPVDPVHPVEVEIREERKQRKLTLNQAMWAGPLKDIERQGFVDGILYPAEMWSEHYKRKFLPDETDPRESELESDNGFSGGSGMFFNPDHVTDPETYHKWTTDPWTGARTLRGSTTQLTDAGMRFYLRQIEADAATEYGVIFTSRDEPQGRPSR